MYNQVGNQFARGNFQFQNIADRHDMPAFADFLLGYQQTRIRGGAGGDEVPRAEPGYYFTDTWQSART